MVVGKCFGGGLEDEVEVNGLIGGVLTADTCWVVVTIVDRNVGKREKDRM